ncbi:hypothetical protein [Hydrocarboniphaga effusa]|uniref:hypothetical protein n=1 Tax=Hydrocarboniphaga effusa TaxID=243629 RepID=UPI003BAA0007
MSDPQASLEESASRMKVVLDGLTAWWRGGETEEVNNGNEDLPTPANLLKQLRDSVISGIGDVASAVAATLGYRDQAQAAAAAAATAQTEGAIGAATVPDLATGPFLAYPDKTLALVEGVGYYRRNTAGPDQWVHMTDRVAAETTARLASDSTLRTDVDVVSAAIGNPVTLPDIGDYADLETDVDDRPIAGRTKLGVKLFADGGVMVREASPIRTSDGSDHVVKHLVVTHSIVAPGLSADTLPAIGSLETLDTDVDDRPMEGETSLGVIYRPHGDRLIPCGNKGTLRGFVAYGDSTTFGADLGTTEQIRANRWTAVLSSLLAVPIDTQGVTSQRAEEIAARMGGMTAVGRVSGGVIPASGSVQLLSFSPQITRSATSYKGWLVTASGQRVYGTQRRDDTTYYFDRAETGSPISANYVEFHTETLDERSRDVLFAAGINNEPNIIAGTQTIAQLKSWISSAFWACRGQCFVWSMLDRGPTEAAGTPVGNIIKDITEWQAATFGARFIDVRGYLASSRALSDAAELQTGFVATADDIAAVSVGTVPPSFRAAPDSVHLNALGHLLQAHRMRRHLMNFYGI